VTQITTKIQLRALRRSLKYMPRWKKGEPFKFTKEETVSIKTKQGAEVVLGNEYKDGITGFSGVAVGRCIYLYGCVRVQLLSRTRKEGDPAESVSDWFDEQRLLPADAVEVSSTRPGGPQDEPTMNADPS